MDKHPEYQYLDLAQRILETGERRVDHGTGNVYYSLFWAQCRYDLAHGFPLLTTKRVYWKWVLTELIWFLTGQTNIRFLVENNVHIWDDYPYYIYNEGVKKWEFPPLTKEEFITKIHDDASFAEKYGELKNIYGEMWRRWPTRDGDTIDQYKFILSELATDPDAKNLIVTAWNPENMYTMAKSGKANKFPICHAFYQFSLIGGKLSCQLYQRTADLFLGVPFNIASYALLTHIIARILWVEPWEFIHTFGDVHIYENHRDQMQEQLTREPRPFPRVKIDPSLKSIDDITFEHVSLEGYDPHPPIKAEMAVVGWMVWRDARKDDAL